MFQPDTGSTSTAVYIVLLSAVVFVYSRMRTLEVKVASMEDLLMSSEGPEYVMRRIDEIETKADQALTSARAASRAIPRKTGNSGGKEKEMDDSGDEDPLDDGSSDESDEE